MEISPGKGHILRSIAAASTALGLLPAGFAALCQLTHPGRPPYAVPVRRYGPLQSRFLQCRGRPLPPCALLTGFDNSPVRDLHPLDIQRTMLPCGRLLDPCWAHTGVWQKWRFSAPQTHLWLIKVWFSASIFVVKIATFAKRQNVVRNILMNTIRLFTILLLLKAQTTYSQPTNSDSLLNNFRKDIEIEQSENAGAVGLDNETKISYYLLISSCSVEDLLKYTNDSNPFVRSYVFAGLLRKEISKDKLLQVLDRHKNDTAKFTSKGVDVAVEWTVKEFMEAGWRLKLSNKLPDIDYNKELERLRSRPGIELKINGISHGLIDKKELLNIDNLILADKEFRVVSFNLFVAEKEMKSTNCTLTVEMKQMIERLEPGEFIAFDNIKVVGSDNMVRRIASLSLKIK
ncbi:MAG: hypothetical protein K8H89_03075 [Flavobacteriales bacterium]|nr:hypothetical protein [Flavobacteriales bacterium]